MNKNRIGFTPAHAALHEVAHPAWLNGISAFSALVLFCGLAACSRPPELIGVDNAEMPVAVSKDVTLHKVFIATTRQT
jgi:hypothetical protein